MIEELEAGGGQFALDPHQIFLFNAGVIANQMPRHTAILGKYQESGGIDIQAPCGCQTL